VAVPVPPLPLRTFRGPAHVCPSEARAWRFVRGLVRVRFRRASPGARVNPAEVDGGAKKDEQARHSSGGLWPLRRVNHEKATAQRCTDFL
jgi:hypothetical protein